MPKNIHIALLGNPNSGKTSLFNSLTGLNQKVGNFPGVTVERKTGVCRLSTSMAATIIDLPGAYSLYPRRADEWVAYMAIMEPEQEYHTNLIVVIVDASNLQRNLLYASQIVDLGRPVVIALTMMDVVESRGVKIDLLALEAEMGVPIVSINPRKNIGVNLLKEVMIKTILEKERTLTSFVTVDEVAGASIK